MRARIGALVAVVFVIATFVWGSAAPVGPRLARGNHQGRIGCGAARRVGRGSGPMTAKAVTDARGTFRIVNLIPGDYTVTATLTGFATTTTRATVAPRRQKHGSPSSCAPARSPRR